jgi:hypothetical protein
MGFLEGSGVFVLYIGHTVPKGLCRIYVYMEPLVKPEILTSYIYGTAFGNAESRLFLLTAQRFNIESMQKVILWHSCV